MTLKIETASAGEPAVLRLVGRIQSEDVPELRAQIRSHRAKVVLDFEEVTLVDLRVVQFLAACEADDVEMLHCPAYIREWMASERNPAG